MYGVGRATWPSDLKCYIGEWVSEVGRVPLGKQVNGRDRKKRVTEHQYAEHQSLGSVGWNARKMFYLQGDQW